MKKNIYISLILAIFIIGIFIPVKSHAAKGSFNLSKSSITITEGKSGTFIIKVSNAEGQFTISSSDTSVATVSNSSEWIDGSLTVTVKGKKAGNATITVTASDVADTDAEEVTGSKTIKVNVKEKTTTNATTNTTTNTSKDTNTSTTTKKETPTVSSDATLKNLGITPKEYDFSTFRKATTSYTVDVPYEAENIKIYAYATHSKATVTGTGSKTLDIGKNVFTVKVTAEDKKTTKKYTLIINRKEQEVEKEDEEEQKEENIIQAIGLTNLKVTGYTLKPEFKNDIYEYKLDIISNLTSLDIQTEKSSENIQVEIVGNENLKEGENVITLLVYNKVNDKTTTYQIIVNKKLETVNVAELNNAMSEAQQNLKMQIWIVDGTIVLIVLLVIIFLIQRYKLQKKQKNENEFYDDEGIEEDFDPFRIKQDDTTVIMSKQEKDDMDKTVKKMHSKPKGKRFK